MAAFEYLALNSAGKKVKGVEMGDSAKMVRVSLREKGLTPLEVEPVYDTPARANKTSKDGGKIAKRGTGRQKMSSMELAVMTRQFATLLDSGMPIEQSLTGLVEQSDQHRIKSILTGVRATVIEGGALADGMRQFPRAFPELYVASVAAGEQTGHLENVLERLADYTEARQGLQQRISGALVYPVILTFVAILIVVGLMAYVVPKVVKVFDDTGQELPYLTQIMISISDFIVNYGHFVLILIALAMMGFSMAMRYPGPKMAFHRFILKFPMTKRLSTSLNTARMARTMSILIGSGVPLISAIKSSSEVVTNLVMREGLINTAEEVQQGASFSRSLKRRKLFPPLLTQMVASGESSGKLDIMLEKSASSLEREAESRISVIVSLFEPMMILFMGTVVLIIVMAILMPIFDLNQLVS
ncbi:MAG: type II secretion system inner membrane protein GspF [Arenicellales bacterium]